MNSITDTTLRHVIATFVPVALHNAEDMEPKLGIKSRNFLVLLCGFASLKHIETS